MPPPKISPHIDDALTAFRALLPGEQQVVLDELGLVRDQDITKQGQGQAQGQLVTEAATPDDWLDILDPHAPIDEERSRWWGRRDDNPGAATPSPKTPKHASPASAPSGRKQPVGRGR